jgi:hypothetical protein
LIISQFVDEGQVGIMAIKMLHSINEFRLRYPHEIQDKFNKDKIESALILGGKFDSSQGRK